MAPASAELSEDKWVENLLKEAEERLSAREVTKKTDPLRKSTDDGNVAAPSPKQAGHESLERAQQKKQDEFAVRVPRLPVKKKDKNNDDNAGADWFNLPRTKATPEMLRDLKLLRMRNVLNPKQFFRKDTRTQLVPTFSQIGTIVEGPTEFYSHRLTRKERKKTLAEEVLSSSDAVAKFRTKYNEIQKKKMSGKKAHYKRLVAQRRKGR